MTLELNLELWAGDEGEPTIIEQKSFDLLSSYLAPDSTIDVSAAAQELHHVFLECSQGEGPESLEGLLSELWDLVGSVAQQIPFDHRRQDKLVQLLGALKDVETDITVNVGGKDGKLWKDLPDFDAALTETGNQLSPEPKERERWISFMIFQARLTRDNVCDRSYDGLLLLRNTLEQVPDQRARAHNTQGPVLNSKILVVAKWISLIGAKYYEACKTGVMPNAALKSIPGGKLWNGGSGHGLSVERWKYWKERFAEIKTAEQLEDGTKVVLDEVVEEMDRIEAEYSST
ncbi:hypothetical protein BDN72DRAFT_829052 [Pluteus cervinus]|uniref:Uncharacterized protein n=1 Tax=Pluteus cervinus TaxID=181527 RepID=A0ACD3A3V1_9AGAR|nr:hypothetical protein BDN72DRAFT_829052 [Pluteus cervinus]